MATATQVQGIEGLQELIGQQLGPSDWREVTQDDIDLFAKVSGDHQWIHVDPERAKNESPFGTTIAHGNFTLSAIDGLREQLMEMSGVALAVNMGWNKVRYPAPVPTGSRIRLTGEVVSVNEASNGFYQVVTKLTIEVEGSEKPACVAESVVRFLPEQQQDSGGSGKRFS